MNTKHTQAPLTLKAAGEPGEVEAVFSTFDVVDSDGDIVLSTALTHGQEVPMAAWGHNWGDLPSGKGQVLVEEKQAVFSGRFFLETNAGLDTYNTVKAMGPLQEWSWGFEILDAAWEKRDGDYVRIIQRTRLFEVSPVLVGAGVGTYTRAIKGGLRYTDQAEAVLAAVEDLVGRTQALADLRAKEGRPLATAHRERLETLAKRLTTVQDTIAGMLAAGEPESVDLDALYIEYQRTLAALNGVAMH